MQKWCFQHYFSNQHTQYIPLPIPGASQQSTNRVALLTIVPRVCGHCPILQPCKQVLRAVLQAEDWLQARALAGQQALRPRVHAAVHCDANGKNARAGRAAGAGGHCFKILVQSSFTVIAYRRGLQEQWMHNRTPPHMHNCTLVLTCRPAVPSKQWDAELQGAAQHLPGALRSPPCPPQLPRGCTPYTALAMPLGRILPSAALSD